MLLEVESFLSSWDIFMPAVWLLVGAGVALSIELSAKESYKARTAVFYSAMGGILLSFLSVIQYWVHLPAVGIRYHTMLLDSLVVDGFGMFMCTGILVGTTIACFSSATVVEKLRVTMADYLVLVLVASTGMVLLVTSNDLIMLFLSIELMSLAIYVLAGCNHQSGRSAEAAMKYFVMGGFASGFLLLGMALLYGVTGEVQLPAIASALANDTSELWGKLPVLGIALMVIGFAFKVGAVPFHQWVPDVYAGAPTPITGLMAVSVKTAAFGAFARFMVLLVPAGGTTGMSADTMDAAVQIIWLLSLVTMVLGNLIAVTQESVKRMLAYSSIAHSGYLLMGLYAGLTSIQSGGEGVGIGAIMFYLGVYIFGTGGAFAILAYSGGERESDGSRDLLGLAWRRPAIGIAMTIFMLSLAGIPLTGGFVGKFFLFKTAIDGGAYWLAIAGILSSMVGAYYYLSVIVKMYMKEASHDTGEPAGEAWGIKFALSASVIATLGLGFMPSLIDEAANSVAPLVLHERDSKLAEQGRVSTPAATKAVSARLNR